MFRIDVDDFEKLDQEIDIVVSIIYENMERLFKQKLNFSEGYGKDFYSLQQLDENQKIKDYPEQPIHELIDDGKNLRLIIDLPGIKYDDINFSYNDHKKYLKISAESKYRSYQTSVYLPKDILYADRLSSFKNGILEIIFPVKKQD